jgi:hypothetical protein
MEDDTILRRQGLKLIDTLSRIKGRLLYQLSRGRDNSCDHERPNLCYMRYDIDENPKEDHASFVEGMLGASHAGVSV